MILRKPTDVLTDQNRRDGNNNRPKEKQPKGGNDSTMLYFEKPRQHTLVVAH